MGHDGAKKTNHMIRGMDFEPSDISLLSGEGRQANLSLSHVANDTINHAYIMKPQENSGHWRLDKHFQLAVHCVLSCISVL